MSDLDIITRFAFASSQSEPQKNDSEEVSSGYPFAIEALNRDVAWLKDEELTEKVISRIWTIEPENSEIRFKQ